MYDREMLQCINLAPFGSWMDEEMIEKEIIDGFRNKVRSIVLEPCMIPMLQKLKEQYGNGYTRVGMTLGYPYGGFTTQTKLMLMRYAVEMGVEEVDVGINITAVRSGDYERAKEELLQIVEASEGKVRIVGIGWLIRNSLETTQKILDMFRECGIRALKTNPGGHFGNMLVEHVAFAHKCAPEIEIEVAGRCRTRETAEAMKLAGASSFHLSSWRRTGGIGDDAQFDFDTKEAGYFPYLDRLE
jgi:deoxyribose-phosphate aldolase